MSGRRAAAAAILAALLVVPPSLQEEPPAVTAVLARKVYVGDGRVLEPGLVVIREGRVVEVAQGTQPPARATVIDARDAVVMPGIVDAYTHFIDTARDDVETVNPAARAIDAVPLHQDFAEALEGGVTTLFVSPGARRLVAGQGAVVKSAPVGDRVVRATYGLKVTLGEASKNPPAIFEPPIPPTAEHPIPPALPQFPATRMGEFALLRELLSRGAHKKGNPHPEWKSDAEFMDPVREVARAERPLWVQAGKADDIVKAVLLAEEFNVKIAIVGGQEADRVADLLARRKVPVILDPGADPLRGTPATRAQALIEGRTQASAAAALSAAGVAVAFQAPGREAMAHVLLMAAWAARGGMDPDAALAALTAVPAEILGVSDRVGTLGPGKDADLLLLSGEPLHPATSVRKVMINGRFVREAPAVDVEPLVARFSRPSKPSRVLAVRGGSVWVEDGRPMPNGLVLVEDGKIGYVGRAREIPDDARVIDATGRVVAPGMINMVSWAGLGTVRSEELLRAGAAEPSPPAQFEFPVAGLLAESDPAYGEALSSGVTCALIAPTGDGVCSLVKFVGADRRPRVLREVAAIRLSVDAGPGAYRGMKDRLERARKYQQEWDAWEKAQKEGKKEEKPKVETPAPAAPDDPISGTWEGTIEAFGLKEPFTLTLKLENANVKGTLTTSRLPVPLDFEATWDGKKLAAEFNREGIAGKVSLEMAEPDHLKGTFEATVQGFRILGQAEARRTSRTAAPAPTAASAEPKKDEKLEPYRPLMRREIPALVFAGSLPAIQNAVRVFREDFNLRFVLMDPTAAYGDPSRVVGAADGLVFGRSFLGARERVPFNHADFFMRRRTPVAFYVGGVDGSAQLPLLAGAAVHYGCDPDETFRGLTDYAARMLNEDRRLGSVGYGRDGDLVLFSGDPFDWRSRVETVIVDGEVVYERKGP
jgi:imidazolonepropionase-like amidohydrolase